MHASHCFSWGLPNRTHPAQCIQGAPSNTRPGRQWLQVICSKIFTFIPKKFYRKGGVATWLFAFESLIITINIIITISFQSIFEIFSMHFLHGPPGWQHYIKYYFLPVTFLGHIISLTSIPTKIVLRLPRINLCKPCMNLPLGIPPIWMMILKITSPPIRPTPHQNVLNKSCQVLGWSVDVPMMFSVFHSWILPSQLIDSKIDRLYDQNNKMGPYDPYKWDEITHINCLING